MGKSLEEQIEVMQHFAKGGTIRARALDVDGRVSCTHPLRDWKHFDYRFVEDKKTLTIEKWLCKEILRDYFVIIESDNIDEVLNYNYSESMCKDKLLETYKVEL